MAADQNLNVFSNNFDALTAIYAENVVIPWKNAPVLDNVAKYESLSVKMGECESVDQVRLVTGQTWETVSSFCRRF